MRATTIVDFDRKELIIPNRTFITDQIINWTLSDPTLRLVITVGVSYNGDIKAAERALLEIARAHPSVLSDPPPSVAFQRFGDSTLDVDLRVFLPSISELIPTRHALNCAILERFRSDGIEIAFPQRDLHIRSAEGLSALIGKGDCRPATDADATKTS